MQSSFNLSLLLSLVFSCGSASASAPVTVPVDLTKYVGRWYQMYADKFVTSTFERDAYCITADYAFNDDGTVAVVNGERMGSVTGPQVNVTATAYPTDEPGQLTVVFDAGAPFPAPYWVVALGPVSSDSGLYDWAVVTDNNQLSLFVLARDVATFEQQYDADVTALLKDMGFTSPRNTPIPTVQDGCVYASEPPSAAAIVATAAAATAASSSSKSSDSDGDCKAVSPLAELDLDAWVEHTWYIQQQQVTGYQSADDLFCVTATYDVSGDNDHDNRTYTVPVFSGTVLGVYNYANSGAVNGARTDNDTVLCAREPDAAQPAALAVAPCFLPNRLAGAYWVIAVGESAAKKKSSSPSSSGVEYDWAVVSGGQPTVGPYPDGGCTTKLDTTNGSGLWIFSKEPEMDAASLAAARQALVDLGYTTSQLIDVPQAGCEYAGAFLK